MLNQSSKKPIYFPFLLTVLTTYLMELNELTGIQKCVHPAVAYRKNRAPSVLGDVSFQVSLLNTNHFVLLEVILPLSLVSLFRASVED